MFISSLRISRRRRASRNRACLRLKLGSIALLLALGGNSTEADVIWIDTDVSIGSPIREVDDAYALILALHSPELAIAGVSTSYGNAPVERTTAVARDLINRFGARADLNASKVFRGAESAHELGHESPATRALASALQRNKRLTYVALAPLTNLATMFALHPALATQVERVIFVGGRSQGIKLRFGPNELLQIQDANVVKDSVAVARVLETKIPFFLTPIETSSRLVLNAADFQELERKGPVGSYLYQHSRVWLWFWTQIARTRGGPIFDALAVVAAIRPELLEMERRYAAIDDSGNLIAAQRPGKLLHSVRFCTTFAARTNDLLRERLFRNARPLSAQSLPHTR